MTNRRKLAKQEKLRQRQLAIFAAWELANGKSQLDDRTLLDIAATAGYETPYETLRQDRHERRVIGHSALDCAGNGCILDRINAAVAWNQPPALWTGGGHAYHRRQSNRRKHQ